MAYHGHSLDIISCLEVQRHNDRLRDKCERLKKTNRDLLQTLLKSQQEVAQQLALNRKLQEGIRCQKEVSDGGATAGAANAGTKTIHSQVSSVAASHVASLRVRLEREQQKTVSQAQTIANLQARCQEADVERQWAEERNREVAASNTELQAQLDSARSEIGQVQADLQSRRSRPMAGSAKLLQELARVTRHRDRAMQERDRLKAELAVLDKDFFQEIEDMKYALEQAVRLNRAYERSLRQVCQKYRLPFPADMVASTGHG